MKMKKIIAAALAMAMALSLVACGNGNKDNGSQSKAPSSGSQGQNQGGDQSNPPSSSGASGITLWTYPIGDWKDENAVKALTDAFTAETGISVKVEYLDYTAGDDRVNTAITAEGTPDLIMEGPERLVANWGANGHMVDLKDMFDDTDLAEINAVNEE